MLLFHLKFHDAVSGLRELLLQTLYTFLLQLRAFGSEILNRALQHANLILKPSHYTLCHRVTTGANGTR